MVTNRCCEVLIIGGGLVGLSLAKGLENAKVNYLLIDENLPKRSLTTRPLALSKSSQAIFRYLGVWKEIAQSATAIEQIHISSKGSFGHVLLKGDPIARVVDLVQLQQKLKDSIQYPEHLITGRFENFLEDGSINVTVNGDLLNVQAKVVVAADGAHSSVRKACQLPVETYPEQTAVLAIIDLQNAHNGLAFERFTPKGSVALLPWKSNQYAMVWCTKTGLIEEDIGGFLSQEFGTRIPKIIDVRHKKTYPLKQMFMSNQVHKNVLFLGNAAHTLHPIAGQGFNLSLRDVVVFLECLQSYGIHSSMFPYYLAMRRQDQRLIQTATHFLADRFSSWSNLFQGLSLWAMDVSDGLKSGFSSYAQGLQTRLPKAVQQYLGDEYE